MNPLTPYLLAFFAILLLTLMLLPLVVRFVRYVDAQRKQIDVVNYGEGRHIEGVLNLYSDVVPLTRYLVVKRGVKSTSFAVTTGIADKPLGVCVDTPTDATIPYAVRLLGSGKGTVLIQASGAISQDDMVEATASGQIQTATTSAGTHYYIGKALNAATNAGDLVEVDLCLNVIKF
jgi:Uncharacterized conserved protein (DUF2190)